MTKTELQVALAASLDAVNFFDRNATRDENRSSPLKGEQIYIDSKKSLSIPFTV